MAINSEQITVVIQGPIYGGSNDMVSKRYTLQSLQSVRRFLPNAQIILSTWENSDIEGLEYDELVINPDPGTTNDIRPLNVNRQIVSTINGLKIATRKYALKLRSDMILEGTGFISFWGKYTERAEALKILDERVVVADLGTVNPKRGGFLFHPTDWCFFGMKDDLLKIFDIELCNEKEVINYFSLHEKPSQRRGAFLDANNKRFSSEQFIWLSFLKKYIQINYNDMYDINEANLRLSELSIVNNLLPVDLGLLNIRSLKYPQADYRGTGLAYTDKEWLKLYNKYCGGTETIRSQIKISKRIKKMIFRWYPITISWLNRSFPKQFEILRNKIRKT